MKFALALVILLASISAHAAVDSWRSKTENGDIIVIEDSPCIYKGRPMHGAGNTFKIGYKSFVEGCYVIQDRKIYYLMNDGDRGWIPTYKFEKVN